MMNCKKHLFDLDDSKHYINGAYMSPISKATEAAGLRAVSRKTKPYQIAPSDFFTDILQLKALFAQIIGCQVPERIALIPSVSYGMATVAQNLKARKGQNIVIAAAQFPSNVYPWRSLAAEQGLQLKTVPYPLETTDNRGKIWNQRLLEAIDNDTVLVALGHIHWANGTLFDLKALSKRAKEVGALFVIDGTQSVGALPFDVAEIQPDALICAGYKWLMGAYSLGYAYYGSYFDNGKPLEESWTGRQNAENFSGLTNYEDAYKPLSTRYDMGEKSNFISVPMGIAALSQLLEWGVQNIQNYAQLLTREAVLLWREKGYWVEDDAWRSHHLFGIQLPKGVAMESLQTQLAARNVLVSLRGDFVRISPNVYNEVQDIAVLTEVLLSV
jgi:selenocysteine lyase/cysteine desulfurase